jgi:hypothetical protein
MFCDFRCVFGIIDAHPEQQLALFRRRHFQEFIADIGHHGVSAVDGSIGAEHVPQLMDASGHHSIPIFRTFQTVSSDT